MIHDPEYDILTPVSASPSPRYSNNGLGYEYDANDPEQCKIAKEKNLEYYKTRST
jgi:hypothetical protein